MTWDEEVHQNINMLQDNSKWIAENLINLPLSSVIHYSNILCEVCTSLRELDKRVPKCRFDDPSSIEKSFTWVTDHLQELSDRYGIKFWFIYKDFADNVNTYVKLNDLWNRGGKFIICL